MIALIIPPPRLSMRILEILLGEHNIQTNLDTQATVRRRVSAFIRHPDFNPTTRENNLALIHLDVPLNLFVGTAIQPVCLPDPTDLFEEVRATVTGSVLSQTTFRTENVCFDIFTQVLFPSQNTAWLNVFSRRCWMLNAY